MSRLPSWLNCGTLAALAGFFVFVILAYVLVQILCYGPGGAAQSSFEYPGPIPGGGR